MGIQRNQDVVALRFICPSDIEKGEQVVISDDLTIASLSGSAGLLTVVGTVEAHEPDETYCTVATKFAERREDRVSGAAVAVGPFVFDGDMKVIAYDDQTHDSAAIAGLVIVAAAGPDEAVITLEY